MKPTYIHIMVGLAVAGWATQSLARPRKKPAILIQQDTHLQLAPQGSGAGGKCWIHSVGYILLDTFCWIHSVG